MNKPKNKGCPYCFTSLIYTFEEKIVVEKDGVLKFAHKCCVENAKTKEGVK